MQSCASRGDEQGVRGSRQSNPVLEVAGGAFQARANWVAFGGSLVSLDPGLRRGDEVRLGTVVDLSILLPVVREAVFRLAGWARSRSLQQKWEPVLRPEGARCAGNTARTEKQVK